MAVKNPTKKKKATAQRSAEEIEQARESVAYDLWRRRYIDGMSYHVIAAEISKSVGWVHEMVQEGAKIVGRWRQSQNQESDFNVAMGRLEFLWETSRQFYVKGNAKHGAILTRVANMHHEICGLKKFEVTNIHTLQAPAVLERVKQVAGQVVSPLVAEVLPLLPQPQQQKEAA